MDHSIDPWWRRYPALPRSSVCATEMTFSSSTSLTFGDLVLTARARRETEAAREGGILMDGPKYLTGRAETQTPSVLTDGGN